MTKPKLDEQYYAEVAEITDAHDKAMYEAKKNYDEVEKELYKHKVKALDAAYNRAMLRVK